MASGAWNYLFDDSLNPRTTILITQPGVVTGVRITFDSPLKLRNDIKTRSYSTYLFNYLKNSFWGELGW